MNLRSLISMVLAIAACVTGVLAIGSTWLHHQLLDTDRWTQSSVLVLRDPEVQGITATFLGEQTIAQVKASNLASGLPAELQQMAAPALGQLAYSAALQALKDRSFEPLWRTASGSTHAQFVRWLNGQDTRQAGDAVILDLQPAVDRLAKQVGVPDALVKQAEQATGGARVEIVRGDQYDQARTNFLWLEEIASLMLPLSVALAALSIAIARYRRAAVIRIGIAIFAAGLIVLLGSPTVRQSFVDSFVAGGTAPAVARSIWEVTSPDLVRAAWITAVAGGTLAILAFATRPGRRPPVGRDAAQQPLGRRVAAS